MGETLIAPFLGGSYITATASGTAVALDVNLITPITIGSVSIEVDTGSVYVLGLGNFEIIRKDSGSPAVNYVFSNTANSFIIDNIGSSPIYFNFNATANPANSGTGFLSDGQNISFNLVVGSISIQGSGITSPSVQVIRLS